MLARCQNPKHQAWANYGGRGITVCERWRRSFEAFWEDMGSGYRPGLDIDRRDNEAGYSPKNCRWVPRIVNSNNKRVNRMVDTPWGKMTVAQASRASGIGQTTLTYRLDHDWPASVLFVAPDVTNRFSI